MTKKLDAQISQQDGTQAGLGTGTNERSNSISRPVVSTEPSTAQQEGTAAEGSLEINGGKGSRSRGTTEPSTHTVRIMYRDESPDTVRLFDSEDAAKAALSEIRDAMRAGKRDVLCAHLEDAA